MRTFDPLWRADVLLLGAPAHLTPAALALKQALRLKGEARPPEALSYGLESYGTGVWLPSTFESRPHRVQCDAPSSALPTWPHCPAVIRDLSQWSQQHPDVVLCALVRLNPACDLHAAAQLWWIGGEAQRAPAVRSLSLRDVSGFLQDNEPVMTANWAVLWRTALVRDELMRGALGHVALLEKWKPYLEVQPEESLASPLPPATEEVLELSEVQR